MMRPNPFGEKPKVELVPNDGEAPVFATPERRGEQESKVLAETKLHDRIRGLFAIADGARSTAGGHIASLSVAEEFQRQLGASLDRKLENISASRASVERRPVLTEELVRQTMELAFMEAHNRLALTNRENPSLRLRAHGAVARMVDTGPNQKELFFALNGKEQLYLVREGAFSRLGEPGAVSVDQGSLGEDAPLTVVRQETLEPGDRLVLLSDGAAVALNAADVEEAAERFADPRALEKALQDFAKSRMEDPKNPAAKAGDLSVIAWEAFPMEKPKPKAGQVAEAVSARRETLRRRAAKIGMDIESARRLSQPSPSGRQLFGAEDIVSRSLSEKTAIELELLALDIPPRFAKGDTVRLATGKTYEVKDVENGTYYLRDPRSPSAGTLVRPRWEIEMAVDPAALPVRAGDRIRVEGFTGNAADDWHVMDRPQPADRFVFEDGRGIHQLAVPAGPTRQALHDMMREGSALQNQTFALKRQVEKTRGGK